jgi:hypothetical protein
MTSLPLPLHFPARWTTLRRIGLDVLHRDPILTICGAVHLLLILPIAFGLIVDSRTILGLNPWVKPLKFALSIATYVLTMAWLMGELSLPRWRRRLMSGAIALSMTVEMVCISVQSLRGTTSHYNMATPFDAVIWTAMSVAIFVNTFAAAAVLTQYYRLGRHPRLRALSRVGVASRRYGLLLFLLGGAEGSLMVTHRSHTVGTHDGGPGLPLLNWSMTAGDLRIAHLLLLHALQLVPLAGYVVFRIGSRLGWTPDTQLGGLRLVCVLFVVISMLALLQALAGRPLVTPF